mmetsp:Transcript_70205/g.114004  ORF Transcript_70205/g.114004 Transcript_70205/m.114004 type:complete len:195 (-) Transcript_70205:171-755(-)
MCFIRATHILMFYSCHSHMLCERVRVARRIQVCSMNSFVFKCVTPTNSCTIADKKTAAFQSYLYGSLCPTLSHTLFLSHSFSHTLSHTLERSLSLLLVLSLVLSFPLSLLSFSLLSSLSRTVSLLLSLIVAHAFSLAHAHARSCSPILSLHLFARSCAPLLQVGELRKFAETHKIDISDCLQKDEIVSRVMQSM